MTTDTASYLRYKKVKDLLGTSRDAYTILLADRLRQQASDPIKAKDIESRAFVLADQLVVDYMNYRERVTIEGSDPLRRKGIVEFTDLVDLYVKCVRVTNTDTYSGESPLSILRAITLSSTCNDLRHITGEQIKESYIPGSWSFMQQHFFSGNLVCRYGPAYRTLICENRTHLLRTWQRLERESATTRSETSEWLNTYVDHFFEFRDQYHSEETDLPEFGNDILEFALEQTDACLVFTSHQLSLLLQKIRTGANDLLRDNPDPALEGVTFIRAFPDHKKLPTVYDLLTRISIIDLEDMPVVSRMCTSSDDHNRTQHARVILPYSQLEDEFLIDPVGCLGMMKQPCTISYEEAHQMAYLLGIDAMYHLGYDAVRRGLHLRQRMYEERAREAEREGNTQLVRPLREETSAERLALRLIKELTLENNRRTHKKES